ncbi:unnamed protein product [Chrysodeixis includens]|uniref:Uncharacterized protein n=1 Tax=Chrysodeixis includens TaxID=689277 RepID=A0A9N8L854_CHRIL|nr:unnamed protein product [Chrysodeixis includens]
MSAKAVLVLCAQALFIRPHSVECAPSCSQGWIGQGWAAPPAGLTSAWALAWATAGLGYGAGLGYSGIAIDAIPTSGSGLPSPAPSENVYEGALSAAGELPFVSAVALEGVLPSGGAGAVSYSCGQGVAIETSLLLLAWPTLLPAQATLLLLAWGWVSLVWLLVLVTLARVWVTPVSAATAMDVDAASFGYVLLGSADGASSLWATALRATALTNAAHQPRTEHLIHVLQTLWRAHWSDGDELVMGSPPPLVGSHHSDSAVTTQCHNLTSAVARPSAVAQQRRSPGSAQTELNPQGRGATHQLSALATAGSALTECGLDEERLSAETSTALAACCVCISYCCEY